MTLYRLTFRALPGDIPVPVRLRWLLKKMLRQHGFRAVKVEECPMNVEHLLRLKIGNLEAKIKSLEEAWRWADAERHNLACKLEELQADLGAKRGRVGAGEEAGQVGTTPKE